VPIPTGSKKRHKARLQERNNQLSPANVLALKFTDKISFTKKQRLLIAIPPFLLATTYITFRLLTDLLGRSNGYLGGFLFYWSIWCGLIPFLIVGSEALKASFNDSENRFGKPKWVGIFFLAGPFLSPFFTIFLPKVVDATWGIVLISAIFAIINGTMEEILWRGAFIKTFPKSWTWSYLYPSIWFGYWHLSPQTVFPSTMPGGAFAFATLSIFMGLTFGWVSKKANSIRYTTIAHILTDFMGLAGLAFMGGGY